MTTEHTAALYAANLQVKNNNRNQIKQRKTTRNLAFWAWTLAGKPIRFRQRLPASNYQLPWVASRFRSCSYSPLVMSTRSLSVVEKQGGVVSRRHRLSTPPLYFSNFYVPPLTHICTTNLVSVYSIFSPDYSRRTKQDEKRSGLVLITIFIVFSTFSTKQFNFTHFIIYTKKASTDEGASLLIFIIFDGNIFAPYDD